MDNILRRYRMMRSRYWYEKEISLYQQGKRAKRDFVSIVAQIAKPHISAFPRVMHTSTAWNRIYRVELYGCSMDWSIKSCDHKIVTICSEHLLLKYILDFRYIILIANILYLVVTSTGLALIHCDNCKWCEFLLTWWRNEFMTYSHKVFVFIEHSPGCFASTPIL